MKFHIVKFHPNFMKYQWNFIPLTYLPVPRRGHCRSLIKSVFLSLLCHFECSIKTNVYSICAGHIDRVSGTDLCSIKCVYSFHFVNVYWVRAWYAFIHFALSSTYHWMFWIELDWIVIDLCIFELHNGVRNLIRLRVRWLTWGDWLLEEKLY